MIDKSNVRENPFTIKFEENYPFLIATLLEHINSVKSNQLNKSTSCSNDELSLIDIIMDFTLKYNLDVELVGDAIRSDFYFKSFIKKDCELHGIIKSEIQEIEEW